MPNETLRDFFTEVTKSFSQPDNSKLSSDQKAAMREIASHLAQKYKEITNLVKEEESKPQTDASKKQVDSMNQELAGEIFIAACASNIPMKEVLAFQKELGPDLNKFNEIEFNPLSAALAGGRKRDDLQALINAGADVNFSSPKGNNSAHFAVMLGVDKDALQTLIDNKVDVNVKNAAGKTPLDIAVEKHGKDSALSDVLKKAGVKRDILAAIGKVDEDGSYSSEKVGSYKEVGGKKSNVNNLKGSGVEVDEKDPQTSLNKALLEAVRGNQPMMALLLIKCGAVVTQETTREGIHKNNPRTMAILMTYADHKTIAFAKAYTQNSTNIPQVKNVIHAAAEFRALNSPVVISAALNSSSTQIAQPYGKEGSSPIVDSATVERWKKQEDAKKSAAESEAQNSKERDLEIQKELSDAARQAQQSELTFNTLVHLLERSDTNDEDKKDEKERREAEKEMIMTLLKSVLSNGKNEQNGDPETLLDTNVKERENLMKLELFLGSLTLVQFGILRQGMEEYLTEKPMESNRDSNRDSRFSLEEIINAFRKQLAGFDDAESEKPTAPKFPEDKTTTIVDRSIS